jgi:hypothetical protein
VRTVAGIYLALCWSSHWATGPRPGQERQLRHCSNPRVDTKDGRDSTNKRWSIWDREGGTGLLITHARTQVDGVGIVGDVELGWMRKLHGVIENELRVVRGQEEVTDEWFSVQCV